MRFSRTSSRLRAVQFVLAICLPLCCCRLQVAMAMMAGDTSEEPDASCISMCCSAQESHSSDSSRSTPADPDSVPQTGTCASCIKGFTPDQSVKPALTLHLLRINPLAAMDAAIPRWSVQTDTFRTGRDEGASTLLRQRCALLI
jgi:hypothetical protein